MTDGPDSAARDIEQYAFLVALANDDVITHGELEFMKRLVLRDGVVDDDEKRVLSAILAKVEGHESAAMQAEIAELRQEFDLD